MIFKIEPDGVELEIDESINDSFEEANGRKEIPGHINLDCTHTISRSIGNTQWSQRCTRAFGFQQLAKSDDTML